MLRLSPKELALLFHDDLERGAPGHLITWYIENEVVPYDTFIDGDFPDEEELLYSPYTLIVRLN